MIDMYLNEGIAYNEGNFTSKIDRTKWRVLAKWSVKHAINRKKILHTSTLRVKIDMNEEEKLQNAIHVCHKTIDSPSRLYSHSILPDRAYQNIEQWK